MKSTSLKYDLFPVYLALSLAILIAGTVALSLSRHPFWASTTAVASLLVALPFSGWLVAGGFLEGDIVVTLRESGGLMPRERLANDLPGLRSAVPPPFPKRRGYPGRRHP